jgi:broad specificity phosphatase PhoE
MDTSAAIDGRFFSGLAAPVDFYIMRHGESVANASGRIQGHADFPLNDNGKAQALAAATYLAGKGISRVFSSPLRRAHDTALAISGALALPAPTLVPALTELDTGCFTGLSMEEIRERFPEDYARFRSMSWAGVSGAESNESLELRAKAVWAMLRDEAMRAPGNVLALTHGGTIQWLVRVCFGSRSWMPILPTGNCSLYRLSVEPNPDGSPAFIQWRDLNTSAADGLSRVAPVF